MKVFIEWIYQTPKKKQVMLTTEKLDVKDALMLIDDFEKTGRTKELFIVDEMNNRWNKKEFRQFMKGIETEPHDVIAYFDGGYNLETKQAGLGIVLYYSQNGKQYRIRKNERFEEINSNNEAEYAAFWLLVQALEDLGVHHLPVVFYGDSQVVLNQLAGNWPVFEEEFNRWIDRIENKLEELGIQAKYQLIGRNENKEADKLAQQALKGISVSSQIELTESYK